MPTHGPAVRPCGSLLGRGQGVGEGEVWDASAIELHGGKSDTRPVRTETGTLFPANLLASGQEIPGPTPRWQSP